MPYCEDDLLALSALQHLLFCPRQCALIHIEQAWVENLYTAQGRLMHERVDQSGRESRKDVRIEYGMPLRSLRLGLIGKADVVEFHKVETEEGWLPFPVEYKRGKEKKENWDKVQLCAQAICLEEMLGLAVPAGALFYGKNRRRQDVVFTDELRRETEDTAVKLHALIFAGRTPAPVYTKRCDSCSFYEVCLPKTLEKRRKIDHYLDQA
ncbi:MAG: CRISPR-associated protein Cas4 [Desulfobacteraceae bacterium]|jgi:CRISPR-associated exonuclease Cas4|nr:MAG: CRISPR-associated protein Cas4 [Desulfobacteraceae bacterium]